MRRGELPAEADSFAYDEVAGAALVTRALNGLAFGETYREQLVDTVLLPALTAAPTFHIRYAGIFSGRSHTVDRRGYMAPVIPGFRYERLRGADGVVIAAAIGGTGSPVVLLHGFPQTHLMWRHVATELAQTHTVITPDLRGYGDSSKPHASSPDTYAKRAMAADVVAVTRELGHDHFALVGHDRGALVAVRAGLDHPETVTHLGVLDVLPTLDMWDVLHGVHATVAWHLYLMAQPEGLPERMIAATADEFHASFLDAWGADDRIMPAEVRAHYLQVSREAIPSIVADYRASAGIDLEHDRADRAAGVTLTMPVAAMAQDWGGQLGFDPEALWRAWAPDFAFHPIAAGHFMAESHPREVAHFIRTLLAR